MTDERRAPRRGAIDAAGPLRTLDLLKLAGSQGDWPEGYVANGFGGDAASFRRIVDRWGFADLGRVADMGAGFGRWSVFLAEVNDDVVAFERNEDRIQLGRKLADLFVLDNLRFEKANIAALPAGLAPFDGAWCNNALHLTDRGKVLRQINRILRVGGRLAVLQFNAAGRVLEKFFCGHALGGLGDPTASFALQSLENGPAHNGVANYGAPEAIPEMLETFGFELESPLPPATGEMDGQALQTLARRLRTDPSFAADFAARPEFATGFLANLDLIAIKRRDLTGG